MATPFRAESPVSYPVSLPGTRRQVPAPSATRKGTASPQPNNQVEPLPHLCFWGSLSRWSHCGQRSSLSRSRPLLGPGVWGAGRAPETQPKSQCLAHVCLTVPAGFRGGREAVLSNTHQAARYQLSRSRTHHAAGARRFLGSERDHRVTDA